jgi:UDP-N-acetylglucosamine acyltransferase
MVGMNSKLVQDALPFCITDGNPARARGINVVGLRRAGFKADEIAGLKDAYRLLYRRVALKEAVAQMKQSSAAAVRELAAFLESGKRGFAHPGD